MAGIEDLEEVFLKFSSGCPVCETPLADFRKFVSGTQFVWVGGCPECKRDQVALHGNNPDRADELMEDRQ